MAAEKCFENCIFVTTRAFIHKVNVDDIFLVERHARKLFLVTEDSEYEYYEKFANVEECLNDDFLKCHSSLVINMRKVKKFHDQVVEFDNGYKLLLGKNSFIKSKQKFFAYINEIKSSKTSLKGGKMERRV